MDNVQLIAEIGCNWDTIDTAYRMIAEAKDCGASYVKFQIFNKDTIAESPVRDKLEPLILDEAKVDLLHAHAKAEKIGFILTPMYLNAVDIADKYCDDYIKIRYADHENEELIEKAMDTGKTLLISVPSKPIALDKLYHPRIKYLYCLPFYPPRIKDFNLEISCSCDGVSSHFPHIICDLAYVINRFPKECFIEKHVMLPPLMVMDKTVPLKKWKFIPHQPLLPIDSNVSVTFEELKRLKSYIKLIEQMERIRI